MSSTAVGTSTSNDIAGCSIGAIGCVDFTCGHRRCDHYCRAHTVLRLRGQQQRHVAGCFIGDICSVDSVCGHRHCGRIADCTVGAICCVDLACALLTAPSAPSAASIQCAITAVVIAVAVRTHCAAAPRSATTTLLTAPSAPSAASIWCAITTAVIAAAARTQCCGSAVGNYDIADCTVGAICCVDLACDHRRCDRCCRAHTVLRLRGQQQRHC